MSPRISLTKSAGASPEPIEQLKRALDEAEAVVIGAGAGLSASAGFVYSGPRFEKYFSDFGTRLGFSDMYSGAFYIEKLSPEERWAYMSRLIWINRYMDPPKPTHSELLGLVKDKDCEILQICQLV